MSRVLHMLLFGAALIVVVGSVHYYLWLRFVRDSGLPSPWRQAATNAIIVLGVSLPLTIFLFRVLPFQVTRYLSWGPYFWLGTMMLLFFWFATVDGIKLAVFLLKKMTGGEPLAVDPVRRFVLGQIAAGGAAFVVGGTATAAAIGAARGVSVIKTKIALQNFPRALDGLTIVQISDLHLGITVGKEWLDKVVRQVNELKPDIVAITGDLVDGFVGGLEKEIAPLADLRTKYGAYFVTGNHEYYFGVTDWIPAIEKLGIQVLHNERVEIGQGSDAFYLAGVDDYKANGMAPGHGPDIDRALDGRDPNKEVVLLAHQPRAVGQAADRDVGLVLSGHTHGGQIWPFTYLVALQQPYNKGLYSHNDKTQIYVNQGTGMWGPPMRLGTRSEITEMRLYRG